MCCKECKQTLGDLILSIWIEYYQIGEASLKEEKLSCLLIESDDSNVMTTNWYSYIVWMKANKNIKLGMLRKNLESLTQNLNKMLEPFKDIILKKEEINNEEKWKALTIEKFK